MDRKFKCLTCVLGTLLFTMLTASVLRSQPPTEKRDKKPDTTKAFMRGKLVNSQKILEGLTTKKFGLIREGAKELQKMSDAASWKRSSDPVYLHYSREFRRLTEKLDRLADDGNLEGASFTYMRIVGTCLSCHEYSRDVLRIANHKKTPKSPFRLLRKDSTNSLTAAPRSRE
jgi:hypothetical protein